MRGPCQRFWFMTIKVELPMTDHLRDSSPNLEKFKAMQLSMCRKIRIMRVAKRSVVLFLTWKSLWILKSKVGPITWFVSWVCHNRSFWDKFLFTLALKTKDMCHATINSMVISWPKLEIYKPIMLVYKLARRSTRPPFPSSEGCALLSLVSEDSSSTLEIACNPSSSL